MGVSSIWRKLWQNIFYKMRVVIRARIAQLVAYLFGTGEVPGSNPGKGKNFSLKISNWIVQIWIRISFFRCIHSNTDIYTDQNNMPHLCLTACKGLWRLCIVAGASDSKNPELYYYEVICQRSGIENGVTLRWQMDILTFVAMWLKQWHLR